MSGHLVYERLRRRAGSCGVIALEARQPARPAAQVPPSISSPRSSKRRSAARRTSNARTAAARFAASTSGGRRAGRAHPGYVRARPRGWGVDSKRSHLRAAPTALAAEGRFRKPGRRRSVQRPRRGELERRHGRTVTHYTPGERCADARSWGSASARWPCSYPSSHPSW